MKEAIALWRLATTDDYQSIGHMFGVAKGLCVIVNEVCQAIVKVLQKRYVKFPAASNEIKDVVNEFETICGFSQCIGAVDGHICPY